MKKRRITGSENPATLTQSGKRKGYHQAKPNRRKKQEKLIQANPGFTFYFDERGVCCYTKKKVR